MMSPTFDTHAQTGRDAWHVLDQKRRGLGGTDTIGLVVQGGGMRGVYSMGALAALEEMGFNQCFDHLAGSSAGALNGAYFITGQASYGVETYIHYLSKKSFVNPFRLKKMVDIDYLVDHIGKKARPLHLHKLLSAYTTLHISLTESSHAQTHYVTNRTPDIDIWEAFRATAAIPLLYNKSVKVGDGRYVDGSISTRIPVRRIVEFGCHYVVVILTMPHSHRIASTNALASIAHTGRPLGTTAPRSDRRFSAKTWTITPRRLPSQVGILGSPGVPIGSWLSHQKKGPKCFPPSRPTPSNCCKVPYKPEKILGMPLVKRHLTLPIPLRPHAEYVTVVNPCHHTHCLGTTIDGPSYLIIPPFFWALWCLLFSNRPNPFLIE